MTMLDVVAMVHLAATAYMAGLCWFVQRVHYPLLMHIPSQPFAAYEQSHTRRTTPITAGPMLIEAASALALAWMAWSRLGITLHALSLSLLAAVWLSTFLVQVPLHRRLERGRDDRAIARLVSTNWIRTLAWSARVAVAAAMVHAALKG